MCMAKSWLYCAGVAADTVAKRAEHATKANSARAPGAVRAMMLAVRYLQVDCIALAGVRDGGTSGDW